MNIDTLRTELANQTTSTARRLIADGTTVLVVFGGGPANQYGLQSSAQAVVDELQDRGIQARQIAANTAGARTWLRTLDPDGIAIWVTDPYRFTYGTKGQLIRTDLRSLLTEEGLSFACQTEACSQATLYKERTMALANAAGVRTIPGLVVRRGDPGLTSAADLQRDAGRVIVKPTDGDEGQGVVLVNTQSDLEAAILSTHAGDADALVEHYIEGTELGIPILVLDDRVPIALPAVEVQADAVILDHHVKNTPGALRLQSPPTNVAIDAVARASADAARLALDLQPRGLIRADFIVDNSGEPWFLEANSFPGLSPTGLVMQSLNTLNLRRSDLALLILSSLDA